MRILTKAAILTAALMIPAATFAGQTTTAKKATAKTEAKADKKAPAVRTHSTSGTVKSSSDSSLVITKGSGKSAKEETFTVNSTTKKDGAIENGAKVTVAYTMDGTSMVATSIKAAPAKAAKSAAKSKKK